MNIQGQSTFVTAGSLSMVPRGLSHSIERRGKNPLIVLSALVGGPCPEAPTAQASGSK